MPIAGFDHVSLPTADSERCIEFYKRLGFSIIDEDKWRNGESRLFAIQIGQSKINVHPPEVWQGGILRGPTALPGCGDLCFVWDGTVEEVLQLFEKNGLEVVPGPALAREDVAAARLWLPASIPATPMRTCWSSWSITNAH